MGTSVNSLIDRLTTLHLCPSLRAPVNYWNNGAITSGPLILIKSQKKGSSQLLVTKTFLIEIAAEMFTPNALKSFNILGENQSF